MDRNQIPNQEQLICNWNSEFPDYQLTIPDLKKPHMFMGALFEILKQLGIDIETISSAPPETECDAHTIYYRDLLPVINMSRVLNHVMGDHNIILSNINITHLLQPNATTSHSILLLLYNLMIFYQNTLSGIAPDEEELFGKQDQVKALEEERNKLLQMLNEQAEEKGKRADRLEKIDVDIKKLEDDLTYEKESHAQEKQELAAVQEENRQVQILVEQKRSHFAALKAKVARKKALRVYDADDVRSQAAQAVLNVKEAEEKLETLKATLMQKESSLKTLQTTKPNLDTANNLVCEVMKLSEGLNDFESGDFELDSREGELEVLQTDLSELRAQLSELQCARAALQQRRADSQPKRKMQQELLLRALKEAEDKEKKCGDKIKKLQEVQEIKERTVEYERTKQKLFEEFEKTKLQYISRLSSTTEVLLKKTAEAKKKIEEKLVG